MKMPTKTWVKFIINIIYFIYLTRAENLNK